MRFRAWWILVVALLAQIVIIEIVPDANRTLLEAVHMATYVAAGVFVAINWRIPGLLVIAAGGAMNGVTIALNGGQLPASKPALQMAGIEVAKGEFINSGVIKDPVLPLFGDIFVWPEPLPFANVFSFGDALIVIGVVLRGAQDRRVPPGQEALAGAGGRRDCAELRMTRGAAAIDEPCGGGAVPQPDGIAERTPGTPRQRPASHGSRRPPNR